MRLLNALAPGDVLPTGQRITGSLPSAETIRAAAALEPPPAEALPRDILRLPGGAGNTTNGEGVVRGVGFAVGFKNIAYSEGFDDYCAARVQLHVDGSADIFCAAAEVGQGVSGVILRGLDRDGLNVHPRTTPIRDRPDHRRARPVAFWGGAMKVVAEVDVDLGLSAVVRTGAAQDVGKAVNPQVEGQIEGGTAQGLGLALMEEIQTRGGLITNASFTDYLIPTALDMPPVESVLIEDAEPDAPYGVKGVGEPPTVVSTAAVVAALRAATGRELTRVPVKPDDICL